MSNKTGNCVCCIYQYDPKKVVDMCTVGLRIASYYVHISYVTKHNVTAVLAISKF